MFERFLAAYNVDADQPVTPDPRRPWSHGAVRGWEELMNSFSGRGFNGGTYRLHTERTGSLVDQGVARHLRPFRVQAYCFGYSWNNLQFALDPDRHDESGEPLILLIDPADGSVFQIDETFESFHNKELIEDPDESIESDLFTEWSWENQHRLPLTPNQVVTYTIPLNLGGKDTISNMSVIDLEVDWGLAEQIQSQLRNQT